MQAKWELSTLAQRRKQTQTSSRLERTEKKNKQTNKNQISGQVEKRIRRSMDGEDERRKASRLTDGQRGRQTNRGQIEKQTNRKTDEQTNRQTNRQGIE